MKKTVFLLLACLLFIFPGVAGAEPAPGNYGDIKGWAENDIDAVTGLRLMKGTGTNNQGQLIFSPEAKVSRAQLATVLLNTFNLDYGYIRFIKQPLASDYFGDVNNSDWYANSLVMGVINNIFVAGGDFKPDSPASRLEIAQAVYRSFQAKNISVPMIQLMPIFEDTGTLSQDEMNAVVFVSNTGILKGSNNSFKPMESMTRWELAGLLMRCVQLMAVNENSLGGEIQLSSGQTFYLSLPSNPTTGYSWSLKTGVEGEVIAISGSTYLEDDLDESVQPTVGRGGRQYWHFDALREGSTNLQMIYTRPWEDTETQSFNLKVRVTSSAAKLFAKISSRFLYSESDTISVNLNIPVISGLTDDSIQFGFNSRWEKDAMDLQDRLLVEIEDYVKYNQQNNFPIRPFQLFTNYRLGSINEKMLSLFVDYYQYTGGAHGITERRPYNYNLQSGAKLSITDLFQADYDYRSVINQIIREQI
ncbi:MAG: DUF4163 domain-containing protein, partial [Peptococcaceae bacterium]|nr:DUF4163 domain-containing protein [Peptococcaceae bacterium]